MNIIFGGKIRDRLYHVYKGICQMSEECTAMPQNFIKIYSILASENHDILHRYTCAIR